MADLPITLFSYGFSPFGQKIRTLLNASKAPYKDVEQPLTLPRPDLTSLGITFRRIPVLAIGKDVYCDSALQQDILLKLHPGVPTSKADKAYDEFTKNFFANCLAAFPDTLFDKDFIKDRQHVFPILGAPHFAKLRPSALAELKADLNIVQNEFLAGSPYIAGDKLTLADIYTAWIPRFYFFSGNFKDEPGFGPDAYPALYEWLKRVPSDDSEKIDVQTAHKTILGSPYVEPTPKFDQHDTLGIQKGALVHVEARDETPGTSPQAGRLIGVDANQVVLELENGIHVHFPRIGYTVYDQSKP